MHAVVAGTSFLVVLVAIALLFDFLNGLHDSANSIATVVATRVLRPVTAVVWASFFNFIAFAVFGLHVAGTVGHGLVHQNVIDSLLIASALGGAIFWNILTWRLGIPSSSSHALVGGLIGAGIAKAGFSAVIWGGFATVASAIVLSPLAGVIAAMALVLVVSWLCVRTLPFTADRRFRKLQFVSSALLSLAHGGNDAQKTMGIITVLLYARGMMSGPFHVPLWVVLSCQTAMALGTLCGGWKIVRTMGTSITHLTPMQGFGAETGAAAALFTATWAGIPVSTTHTITGAIVGVGAARRISAVRWGVARRIVIAWCVTLPAAATVGAGCYWITRLIFG
jgi:inorganic phosphate transporter, PiT family